MENVLRILSAEPEPYICLSEQVFNVLTYLDSHFGLFIQGACKSVMPSDYIPLVGKFDR